MCTRCNRKFTKGYGKEARCPDCINEYARTYYNNISKHKESYKNTRKKYSKNTKDKAKRRSRKHYLENKKQVIKRTTGYNSIKRKTCPIFRLKQLVRNRINDCLKNKGVRKRFKSIKYLGCTWEELKEHLENQFVTGMSWRNRHLWHIDHIIPLALFDLSDTKQQEVAFHVTNLQPLWAHENLKKGGR